MTAATKDGSWGSEAKDLRGKAGGGGAISRTRAPAVFTQVIYFPPQLHFRTRDLTEKEIIPVPQARYEMQPGGERGKQAPRSWQKQQTGTRIPGNLSARNNITCDLRRFSS